MSEEQAAKAGGGGKLLVLVAVLSIALIWAIITITDALNAPEDAGDMGAAGGYEEDFPPLEGMDPVAESGDAPVEAADPAAEVPAE